MSNQPNTSFSRPAAEASEYEIVVGTRRALGLLAGKWSVEVLYVLASGTRRYSGVLSEVGDISKKALTQTLRALERQGLIARHAYPELPPRVEYSLTSLGWAVTGMLMTLYEWSAEHLAAPAAAVDHPRAVAEGTRVLVA
jgi:DNA-binding HxlR family transcriptional regulator